MRKTELPRLKWPVYIHELGYPRTFQKIMSQIKGERDEPSGEAILQKEKEKKHLGDLNVQEEKREQCSVSFSYISTERKRRKIYMYISMILSYRSYDTEERKTNGLGSYVTLYFIVVAHMKTLD